MEQNTPMETQQVLTYFAESELLGVDAAEKFEWRISVLCQDCHDGYK